MPRPSGEHTTPEVTPWKIQRERRKHPADTTVATLDTAIRPVSGELRCPICEQVALADADRLMLWHDTARADGESVRCPGVGAAGTDPADAEAA